MGKLYIDDGNGDRWLSFRDNQWIVVTVEGDPSTHVTGGWPFRNRPLREATDAEIKAFNASFMPQPSPAEVWEGWKDTRGGARALLGG